ncbi:response regulator [Maritalea sp.]|uniref:response regulator n=1 Tax=Maritalea sp. TaxID=2003361 RepID=UPI003EFB0F6F
MELNKNMRILIVDDYATMLRILRNLLKQLGFEDVHEASDGQAALKQFENNTYDLVISDWNMEPMTGFDLLRAVRSNPETAETKFIMITAESATENVIAAKRAGVNNYIIKPFTSEILMGKIEAVFQQRVA